MQSDFLHALKKSLKSIEPVATGIVYLLYRIDDDFWIPIATSQEVLEEIPYYRLSYAFKFKDAVTEIPILIDDNIESLVHRGKIESLSIGAPFYQEVTLMSDNLVIVRSSKTSFSKLSDDAINMSASLYEVSHAKWGKEELYIKMGSAKAKQSINPLEIVKHAVDFLSDRHPFPPYFMQTDYIITLSIDSNIQEQHIYSNPLGYSYWLHKTMSTKVPPWVFEMAKKANSYAEDLLNPSSTTLKELYLKALGTDILACHLAKELIDDVVLVAYAPKGPAEAATVKVWARHNRPRKGLSIVGAHMAIGCDTPVEALKVLLGYAQNSEDYLLSSWAILNETSGQKIFHVSCDASLKSLFTSKDLGLFGQSKQYPDTEGISKYVQVRYPDGVYQPPHESISELLENSYALLLQGDTPRQIIASFWEHIASKKYYHEVMFPAGGSHETSDTFWQGTYDAIKPHMIMLMSDLCMIAHLGKWSGFREYDDQCRKAYLHIGKAFAKLYIAAELVDFIVGKTPIDVREKFEFINVGKETGALLEALYILRSDGEGWDLDTAKSIDKFTFAIKLKKVVEKDSAFSIARNAFGITGGDNTTGSQRDGELISATNKLINCAKKYCVEVTNSMNNTTVSIYAEFVGGNK